MDLKNEYNKIKAIVDQCKSKKKELDDLIKNKCIHLEYYEREYDDGHRWGTDYYCKICHSFLSGLVNDHGLEREYNEVVWNKIKKLNTERHSLLELIKKNEIILSNINTAIIFQSNNKCAHDVVVRHQNTETYEIYYQCSGCDSIMKYGGDPQLTPFFIFESVEGSQHR